MGLNLNSLKNLSPTGTDTITEAENIAPIAPSALWSAIPEASPSAPSAPENAQEKKIPATGPKISLMKLKRDSWMDNNGSVKATEVVMDKEISLPVITDQAEEENVEIWSSTDLTQMPEKEEVIAILPSSEVLPTEQETLNPEESLSILSDEKTSEPEQIQQEAMEAKEFFPNFHISNKMDLDADLLDLQDFVTIKEHEEATTVEQQEDIIIAEHEEILPVMETVSPEEVPEDHTSVAQIEEIWDDTEIAGIPPMEPIAETIPEAILSEESSDNTAIPATPEYVAEVKAELSEQRRAGFRFFAQKKTKIMAGSLITLSLVAIALLSSPFLSESIQKSGKTNIQETIKNGTMGPIEASGGTDVENTGTSAVVTDPISPVEITSYEIGRDYSVAKNTKKNTRTKTSSGATSGTGAPTP